MTQRLMFATEESYLRAVDSQKAKQTRAVLTFNVGGENYGLDILSIREIIKAARADRGAAHAAVLDRHHLGARRGGPRDRSALVAQAAGHAADARRPHPRGGEGRRAVRPCKVDSVNGVVRLVESEIRADPVDAVVEGEGVFLSGIGRHRVGRRERMVILLNLAQVVSFHGAGT